MNRLLLVANRLPISITKRLGELRFAPSPGGLATGLSSLSKSYQCHLVGWPGIASEKLTTEDIVQISKNLSAEKCSPVFLSQKQIEHYYLGFSNKTIWPLRCYREVVPIGSITTCGAWPCGNQCCYSEDGEFCEQSPDCVARATGGGGGTCDYDPCRTVAHGIMDVIFGCGDGLPKPHEPPVRESCP